MNTDPRNNVRNNTSRLGAGAGAGDSVCPALGPGCHPCGAWGSATHDCHPREETQVARHQDRAMPRAPQRGPFNETYRARGRWFYVRFRNRITGQWVELCTGTANRRHAEEWFENLHDRLLGCPFGTATESQVVALAAS